jgi:hypothetical protein
MKTESVFITAKKRMVEPKWLDWDVAFGKRQPQLHRFLDADLSTNFDDFHELVNTISNSKYKIVSGSRINRMGADMQRIG